MNAAKIEAEQVAKMAKGRPIKRIPNLTDIDVIRKHFGSIFIQYCYHCRSREFKGIIVIKSSAERYERGSNIEGHNS